VRTLSRLVPKKADRAVVYGLPASEDGALAVQAALVARGLRTVRLTDEAGGPGFRNAGVAYRPKRSLRGVWSVARAGVVLTSHALYGGLRGGPGQRMVLLWHGEVVKPVGLLDGDRGVPADVAPVCSPLGRAFRCAEFGLQPAQVPVVGAPRNDRMLRADAATVRRRLGWRSEDPTWLWLPTYREAVRGARRQDGRTWGNGLPFDAPALRVLDSLLAARDLTMVVKAHPLAEQDITGGYQNLRVLSQRDLEQRGVSLYEVLAAVDGLVTDVSSVWLDYLLTERPIVFAFPDLEEYARNRGLNLEPYKDWVPGPLVTDVEALADQLGRVTRGDDPYREQRHAARLRFHRHHDARSTERLLDLLGLPAGPPPLRAQRGSEDLG
jgi:hypothetical protein